MSKVNILDEVILNIEGNLWTVRDACTGVMVFGMTGSGKSSGPLHKIANKFLTLNFGGVVFCAKPDECDTWIKYAKEAHREDDLLFLSKLTFNYLDHESRRSGRGGGQIENLVNLYLEIVNMGKDKRNSGGGNDEYWNNAVKQLLRNTMTILQMAGESINIENIYRMVISAPSANGNTAEESSYCTDLMALSIPEHLRQTPEFEIARTFFLEEFAHLDERTRSNTVSSFSVTADSMQRGELARCFSAPESTLHLEDIYRNHKILIVDYDQKSWGRMGQYAAGIIKYCFEMMIERREDISNNDAPPVFLWADECQFFSLDYDQKFQTTARSSRTLTVYATQNLGNLYDGYGKEKASSLLGNLGTKFFCQNGEFETNEWASKSIGQEIILRKNKTYGDSKSSSMKGDDNKSLSFSEGYSEQKDYRVDPADFSTLQTGGPRGQCKVGFIFWQSGRILNNGSVYIRSTIEQQCRRVCGAKFVRHCPVVPTVGGKGEFIGEKQLVFAGDYLCFIALLLTSVIPLTGAFMVYTGNDIPIAYYNDKFYCCVSTLCFYTLSVVLDIFCSCLKSTGAIFYALISGKPRKKKKFLRAIIWQDAILGYYAICVGMTLWLQYNIFDIKEAMFILICWIGLCMFFRYLRTSGKMEINPNKK